MTIKPNCDKSVCVEFEHGSLYLQYDGDLNVFMNDFEGILDYFVKQVLEDYNQVRKGSNYEDCFDAMIKNFETVECPYLSRPSIKLQFDRDCLGVGEGGFK